jgi:hypothetical protein
LPPCFFRFFFPPFCFGFFFFPPSSNFFS